MRSASTVVTECFGHHAGATTSTTNVTPSVTTSLPIHGGLDPGLVADGQHRVQGLVRRVYGLPAAVREVGAVAQLADRQIHTVDPRVESAVQVSGRRTVR